MCAGSTVVDDKGRAAPMQTRQFISLQASTKANPNLPLTARKPAGPADECGRGLVESEQVEVLRELGAHSAQRGAGAKSPSTL